MLAACAGSGPEPVREPGAPSAEPENELLDLAEDALDRGDTAAAERRFQRVLRAKPDSARALAGLGGVELARGQRAEARAHFERVVRLDPTNPEVHARLATLTGNRPGSPEPTSPEEALVAMQKYPYDPEVLLPAAQAMIARNKMAVGLATLERIVWLADLNPAAARRAIALLKELDPRWSERKTLAVHVTVDEALSSRPGWRSRQRTLWLSVSRALDKALPIRFVPLSFRVARVEASLSLEEVLENFVREHPRSPGPGIIALFTEHPVARPSAAGKLGLAQFLGRLMVVRLPPGERESRVLAHEILHLFGAIHVTDAIDSLMNPQTTELTLDPLNYAIVQALRSRHFSGAGFGPDILSSIDLRQTIDAYSSALNVNLGLRKLALQRALKQRSNSRYLARRHRVKAMELDSHLGDVAKHLALLVRADQRPAQAVFLFETAAHLYGPDTPRGRAMLGYARSLTRSLQLSP